MSVSRCVAIFSKAALALLTGLSACSADGGAEPGESDAPPNADDGARLGAQEQDLSSPIYGTVTYLGDIPSKKGTDGWFEHAQGVALGLRGGNVNMFYSTNGRIYGREAQSSSQFGVSQSMPAAHWEYGIPHVLSVAGFDHYGDLDFAHTVGADALLVPMERDAHHDKTIVASFVVADDYFLFFNSYAELKGNGGHAPWVAASKTNPGLLYSSGFDTSTIIEYRDSDPGPGFTLDDGTALSLKNKAGESMTLTAVQGGEFNLAGRLFLIAEGPAPGVYGFERSGAVYREFDFYPAAKKSSEEFEGITVGLIDPPGANDRSQIHAVLNQGGYIFFKHWSVSQRASDFTLP
jgi:hypothetical protein